MSDQDRRNPPSGPELPGLKAVLRDQTKEPPDKGKTPAVRDVKVHSQGLNELLLAQAQDNRFDAGKANSAAGNAVGQELPGINSLLREMSAGDSGARRNAKPVLGESLGQTKNLNELLNEQGRDGVVVPSARSVDPAPTSKVVTSLLHEHLSSASPHSDTLVASEKNPNRPISDRASSREHRWRPLAIVAALLVLVVVVGYWKGHGVPDSALARQLLAVAADVDKYKAAQGKLPAQLGLLPSFPEEAIEWPIENYGVQLPVPKPEYFMVDAPGGYILIAKYADEVWVYDSMKSSPLRREMAE